MAVIDPDTAADSKYNQRSEADFRVEWFSGSGAGGQHRNKHQNSCRVYHIPTGLVEARQGRERSKNLAEAKAALLVRLDAAAASQVAGDVAVTRREQVGLGQRADKSVTIRLQDDRVTNHGTDKVMSARKYMRGHMDDCWQ